MDPDEVLEAIRIGEHAHGIRLTPKQFEVADHFIWAAAGTTGRVSTCQVMQLVSGQTCARPGHTQYLN